MSAGAPAKWRRSRGRDGGGTTAGWWTSCCRPWKSVDVDPDSLCPDRAAASRARAYWCVQPGVEFPDAQGASFDHNLGDKARVWRPDGLDPTSPRVPESSGR